MQSSTIVAHALFRLLTPSPPTINVYNGKKDWTEPFQGKKYEEFWGFKSIVRIDFILLWIGIVAFVLLLHWSRLLAQRNGTMKMKAKEK